MQHPDRQAEHEPEREHDQPQEHAGHAPETGVPAVDEVLASLGGLEDHPVSEHVATFERAHQRLRRVLDGSPDPAPDAGDGV
jgi:hypothetical protein